MPEARTERWLAAGLVAALLLALGIVSLDRARRGRYDFHHFFLDARYVWEHRALHPVIGDSETDSERQLPFYLPVVPLALAPLAAFGRLPAAVLWTLGQLAAVGYALAVLWRWRGRADARGAAAFLLAVLLAVPAFIEAARFNQVSFFVLALVLGGLAALERGRDRAAGALLAAAAVLKLLPALFLPWLLLKRRWTAAAALVLVAGLLAVVPPMFVFGPRRTAEYHRQWWAHNWQISSRMFSDPDLPEHFVDRRNQSVAQVLARWTWPAHRCRLARQPLHLELRTIRALDYAVRGGLLLALLWATRLPWARLTPTRRRAEGAAYAVALLVLAPLLRQYYLVWAAPALLLLTAAAAAGPTRGEQRLGRAGAALWAAGMLAWAWPLSRVAGVHLLMLMLLAALLLAATRPRAAPAGEPP